MVRGAAVVILMLVSFSSVVGQVSPPPFLLKWGGFGAQPGQFNTPVGAWVDAAGNVYIADRMNHRVQKFTSDGVWLATLGSQGTGDGQFAEPFGVAVDDVGNIYVSDIAAHRIQKFTSTGAFVRKWGSLGSLDGQFRSPSGISLDPAGNLYVADQLNHRIQKFAGDGTFMMKWGRLGTANGEFTYPMDVAIDPAGYVYVGEFGGHRMQKFDPAGAFITKWGVQGSGPGEFTQVGGVAVDASRNVYVADRWNRIQQFDDTGQYLTAWGSLGSANGQFNVPAGIAADHLGNVFVVDRFNHRVQRFGYEAPVNRPPVADAGPDQAIECSGPGGASATLDGSQSSDPDGDPLQYAWSAGAAGAGTRAIEACTFPLGSTSVVLTVTDPSGLNASDTATIEVADTTSPAIAGIAAQPGRLWPVNGKMIAVEIDVQARDACDAAPVCRITTVTSNEPIVPSVDWTVTGGLSVQLRAQRLGAGNGRIYTVSVACSDASGNLTGGSVTIQVLKSASD